MHDTYIRYEHTVLNSRMVEWAVSRYLFKPLIRSGDMTPTVTHTNNISDSILT